MTTKEKRTIQARTSKAWETLLTTKLSELHKAQAYGVGYEKACDMVDNLQSVREARCKWFVLAELCHELGVGYDTTQKSSDARSNFYWLATKGLNYQNDGKL